MLNRVFIDINSDIATIEIPQLINGASVIEIISTSHLPLGSYVAVLGYPSVQGFNDINTRKFTSLISSTGKLSVLSEANTSFYSQYFSKPNREFGQINNVLVNHGNSGGGVFYKDIQTGEIYLIGILSGADQSELTQLNGGRSNIVFSLATNAVPTSTLPPQP